MTSIRNDSFLSEDATLSAFQCNLHFADLLQSTRQSIDAHSDTELEPESEEDPSSARCSNRNPSVEHLSPESTSWVDTSLVPPFPPPLPTPSTSTLYPPSASFILAPMRPTTLNNETRSSSTSDPPPSKALASSLLSLASIPPASTRYAVPAASHTPRPLPSHASASAPLLQASLSFTKALVTSASAPASAPSVKRPRREMDGENEVDGCPQSKANARRRRRRINEKGTNLHTNATNATKRKTILAATQLPVEITARDFRIAYGAYCGIHSKPYGAQVRYSLERLERMEFQLIRWDGLTPILIVDRDHRVFAVLAGRPGGMGYVELCMRMHERFVALRKRITWKPKEKRHKRGTFVALNTGIGYGKGQQAPMRFSDERQILLEELLNDIDVQRVAAYQDSILARYFPKLYQEYRQYMQQLEELLPTVKRNFRLSVFAMAAFNLGPDVWTWLHKDAGNDGGGECLITALGPFDPTRSALMILWELKLVIQFPHASTIAIPSASVTHSNTPVADGDERSSFTQYMPGGIFRWLDNGGRTDQELESQDFAEFMRLKNVRGSRWERALNRFSTLSELVT